MDNLLLERFSETQLFFVTIVNNLLLRNLNCSNSVCCAVPVHDIHVIQNIFVVIRSQLFVVGNTNLT